MTPERYQRIQWLVDIASQLDPERRRAFLDRECAGDEELRREVERLLSADARTNSFMETPAMERVANARAKVWKNRYEGEEILGRGAFGIVYRARDRHLGARPVAVKELLPGPHLRGWQEKFLDEIKALTRFDHPHIVRILDWDEDEGGDPFFVMAYVAGPRLCDAIARGGMDGARVARLMRQICDAVGHAHERNVFHRDLKPANIMLQTAAGEELVQVMDFGLAKVKEWQPSATRGGPPKTLIAGTPPYMAPEQLDGDPPEHSDQWALGVITYELLTGQLPFDLPPNFRLSPQGRAQLGQIYRAGIKARLQTLRPDLPPAAEAVILKALAFEPHARHASAGEFSEELARALTVMSSATPAKPPPPLHQQTTELMMATTDVSPDAEVVISCCDHDLSRAHQIADRLREVGVNCWMSDHSREASLNDSSVTGQAIRNCRTMLLLCSDAALQSRAVKEEMQLAWKYKRPFLPLLVEPTDSREQVEYWLEGQQRIKAMDSPPDQWLPLVLRALANAGVRCPGVKPSTLENVPITQPTRLDQSLKSLRLVAGLTNQIWPLPAGRRPHITARSATRGLVAPRDDVQHSHRLGSRVCLAIKSDRESHLLLLDEGPEKILYCLCPSHFAPDTRLQPGCNYLPQMGSRYDSFEVSGKPGREHLLAIVSDEPLGLNWLPDNPRTPARVLSQDDVSALLAQLRGLDDHHWTALSTYFDLVD